ncbi:M16 family metallopeptidase [Candidatus Endomicrobiellum devescovinae]|jgi:predicted Zn-dependent peptidase|uniref:M16 family metallopeptidase n=1 Tax=Candidatus Endomicrobiellum devescovinae TaxID=3242322 RepID=UPI002837A35A|nr:insulinase family protein [Endomicrobium sp.]
MESFTLKNGINVLFDKTNGSEIVSLRVLSPVSVINEGLCNAGITSLTSKLMVYSTKNRSSEILAKDVGNIGADLSSGTAYDMAGFSMSCLSEYFDKAAELLSDIVLNPIFDEREFKFEKENAIAALNSRKDSIGVTASDEFAKLFYGDSSYSFPVIGRKESILKISREDLVKWYKYSYNASNILISVSGNVSYNFIKESLEKHFSAVAVGDKFKDPIFNISHTENIKKEISGKFNQAYIFIGFPCASVNGKDFVTIKVISTVLGSRMTSRLFVELREKLGLAYEVSAAYPSRKKDSYFAVYIGLDKKNIDLTLKKIDEILKDFYSVKISEQELKDVKSYIKGIYLLDRQTVNKKSYYNGWREIVGQGYKYDIEYSNDIEKVTTQDILEVANKIFRGKSVSVIINPEE